MGPPSDALYPSKFAAGASRESAIRRDAQGRWFHQGQPVEHPGLIRAFDRWIDRAEDGRFCLRNRDDWVYISLEGPPFFVRSLRFGPADALLLALSDGREEPLEPDTLRQGEHGGLFCDVRSKTMVAGFDRHAMMQLESVIDEDAEGVFLKLGGTRVRPPVVEDPLQPVERDPYPGG